MDVTSSGESSWNTKRCDVQIKPRMVPRLGMPSREMERVVSRILDIIGLDGASLEVRVTGDAEIAVLNEDFLCCTGPTNVLSFPAEEGGQTGDDGDDNPGFLGSVVLSAHTLERECILYGQPLHEHMIRLLTHAILHLVGMEHGLEMEELTESAVKTAVHDFQFS